MTTLRVYLKWPWYSTSIQMDNLGLSLKKCSFMVSGKCISHLDPKYVENISSRSLKKLSDQSTHVVLTNLTTISETNWYQHFRLKPLGKFKVWIIKPVYFCIFNFNLSCWHVNWYSQARNFKVWRYRLGEIMPDILAKNRFEKRVFLYQSGLPQASFWWIR